MIKTGKIRIENVIERVRFVGPDRREVDLEVTYLTDKGYRGTVTVPKADVTEEKIWKAVTADSKEVEKALGAEREE